MEEIQNIIMSGADSSNIERKKNCLVARITFKTCSQNFGLLKSNFNDADLTLHRKGAVTQKYMTAIVRFKINLGIIPEESLKNSNMSEKVQNQKHDKQ